MINPRLKKKILPLAAIFLAIGVAATVNNQIAVARAATTISVGNPFAAVSGNIDSNFAYTSYKGGASTAPALNGGDIRLYQNGGYITVSSRVADFKMTSLTITNSGVADGTGPFSAHYIANGAINTPDPAGWVSISSPAPVWTTNSYTYSDLAGFTHFKLVATGTSSSTRVYVDTISITYDYFGAGSVSVTEVHLNKSSASLFVGETETLTSVVLPENATDKSLQWTSNNTSVATVNITSGLVTAVSAGTATIKAQSTNPSAYAECVYTISTVSVTGVTLNKTSSSLFVGQTDQLSATVAPANATNKAVTWSSLDSAVASVNASGLVSAVGAGSTTIIATTTDGGFTASYTTTVTAVVLNSISIKTPAVTTTFPFGSHFNSNGLVLTANYNSGAVDISGGYEVTGVDTKVLGNQTATVSFGGKTTSYSISVTNQGSAAGVVSYASDLIISEYVEGSSNNKYLEIFNGTGSSKDLSDYKLQTYANGGATPESNITLSGTLLNNTAIVYRNSAAILSLPSGVTATINAAVNFNGDDAVALYKISTSSFVDIFGIIGSDPGSAWTGGVVTTVNKTLVRKSTVINGVTTNPSTFDPSQEWEQHDVDDATHLGSHTMNFDVLVTNLDQAVAYAYYFLTSTASYCASSNGGASPWSTLSSEYGYMSAGAKDEFYSNSSDTNILGAKARYSVLVHKYSTLASDNFMKNSGGVAYVVLSANEGSVLPTAEEQPLQIVLIVALLGVTALAGYFITNRKKEEQA